MKHISSLQNISISNDSIKRRSERGDLLDYFFNKLVNDYFSFRHIIDTEQKRKKFKNYLAFRISHLRVRDLYFLKSSCEDSEKRGYDFSKAFWGSLKTKNIEK